MYTPFVVCNLHLLDLQFGWNTRFFQFLRAAFNKTVGALNQNMEEVSIQFTLWYFCLVVYGKFSGGKNVQNKYVFQSIMWIESSSPLSHGSGGFLKIPQKNMKTKPSILRYTHLFPLKIHEFWGRKRRRYKWLPPKHYPPSITPKPKVVPRLLGGHRCRRLEDGGWGEDGYWCNLGKNFPKTSKCMLFLLWALDICPRDFLVLGNWKVSRMHRPSCENTTVSAKDLLHHIEDSSQEALEWKKWKHEESWVFEIFHTS